MNANANKAPFKQGFRIEINHILFFLILPHKGHLNKKSQGYETHTTEVASFAQAWDLTFVFVELFMYACIYFKLRGSEKNFKIYSVIQPWSKNH